jgi:ADP-heptose:LPS heptosyltransferase
MKFLIIHSGPAEDIIFSTVLIRVLKVQSDAGYVGYLTSDSGREILKENPYLDFIATFSEESKQRTFDYIIDLDADLRSFLATMPFRGKVLRHKKFWFQKWLLTKWRINKLPQEHVVNQFLNIVSHLSIKDDGLRLDYSIPYKDEVPRDWLPELFRKSFVVFCINARFATRKLPVERIIELCDRINKPVILLGTADDAATGKTVEEFFHRNSVSSEYEEGLRELNKKTVVYNACGKFNIHQQASLVKQARYVFTFDNEFVAVASAFGKEVYVTYGNTSLDFGRYPHNTRFTIFENNRISCRPCAAGGYPRCPLTHFKCMNDVVFDFYLPW